MEAAIHEYPENETFADVLASLKEMRELQKAMQLETSKKMEETREQMKETDRIVKENARQMGYLNNRFGELAEHLVAPGVADKFNEIGHNFNGIASGGYKIKKNKETIAEIDILLENGESIMAVEVKSRPRIKDIEQHIKRLEILREHRNEKNDNRKIRGAIAGAVFEDIEKKAAIKAGFYVLTQSGDTMKMDIPDGFIPREW